MDHAPTQNPSRLLIIGLLFVAVAGIAWFTLHQSKAAFTNFVMPGDPGPFFLADVSIAIIGLAGVALVVQSLVLARRLWPAGHAGRGIGPSILRWALPVGFVVTLIALPSAMTLLGTPAALAIFAFGWILALQMRSGKPLAASLIVAAPSAAAASAFVQLVFIRLLATPLPA